MNRTNGHPRYNPNMHAEEDAPTSYANGACYDCRDNNPQVRHQHYLTLAKNVGLEEAYAHILEDLAARFEHDTERARSYADSIKLWLEEQIDAYRGKVDAQTGAQLTWWEARRRTIAAMHETYDMIAQASRQAQEEKAMQRGRGRLVIPDDTPLREPGEEDESEVLMLEGHV